MTGSEYCQQLFAAGFIRVAITRATDAGGGLSSAIVQAVRLAASTGISIRPTRSSDARSATSSRSPSELPALRDHEFINRA